MRRIAIASFVVPFIGVYLIYWRFPRPPSAAPGTTADLSALQPSLAFLVLVPAIVGLALGLLVLFAPLFGRKRAGVTYAAFGICLSALLLFLVLAEMFAR